MSEQELCDTFLQMEYYGCHNLHWISPAHQLPWLLDALNRARAAGLTLPVVYNTGGYESVHVLEAIEGRVEIYLPDFKYWSDDKGQRYLGLRDYPSVTRAAIKEMHRQVGDLALDSDGVATRGLLIRHLVMPGELEEARCIFDWIVAELGPQTYVNVMPQYRPEYRSNRHPELAHRTKLADWAEAVRLARAAGLTNLCPYPGLGDTRHLPPRARRPQATLADHLNSAAHSSRALQGPPSTTGSGASQPVGPT